MKFANWMMAFPVAVGMIFAAAGCGESESDVCNAAKQQVSEQCARLGGENPPTCVSVELTGKIADGCWNAEAKLDNGKSVPLIVKRRDDRVEADLSAWLAEQAENDDPGKDFKAAGEELGKGFRAAGEKFGQGFRKAGEKIDEGIKKATENLD